MFINAKDLQENTDLSFDLCIIGGGPAGITLAQSFLSAKERVALLESGEFLYNEDLQNLNEGVTIGPLAANPLAILKHPSHPQSYLKASRVRQLGGASNHWGGLCVELEDHDFQKKNWIAHSGWPIQKKDLSPYLKTAKAILDVTDSPPQENLFQGEPSFHQRWIQRATPVQFGAKFSKELKASLNVHAYLGVTATHIQLNKDKSRVEHLDAKTSLGKKTIRIRAKYFVLCLGAIENARLLLSSSISEDPQRDSLIGRFFMEHPEGSAGLFFSKKQSPTDHRQSLKNQNQKEVHAFSVGVPSFEFLEKNRTQNFLIQLQLDSSPHQETLALLNLYLGTSNQSNQEILSEFDLGPLFFRMEQAPHPENRVVLDTRSRDRFGLFRPKLLWELKGSDQSSIKVGLKAIGEILGKKGLGRIKIDIPSFQKQKIQGQSHHMGTTRMSETARDGVVDSNLRVHSLRNLYIAGSSVFPTSGAANPTLTLVALSLRLGDFLKIESRK